MDIIILFIVLVLMIIGVVLGYQTFKYGKTMWKFKNRKKDGSEDDDFRYFD